MLSIVGAKSTGYELLTQAIRLGNGSPILVLQGYFVPLTTRSRIRAAAVPSLP